MATSRESARSATPPKSAPNPNDGTRLINQALHRSDPHERCARCGVGNIIGNRNAPTEDVCLQCGFSPYWDELIRSKMAIQKLQTYEDGWPEA